MQFCLSDAQNFHISLTGCGKITRSIYHEKKLQILQKYYKIPKTFMGENCEIRQKFINFMNCSCKKNINFVCQSQKISWNRNPLLTGENVDHIQEIKSNIHQFITGKKSQITLIYIMKKSQVSSVSHWEKLSILSVNCKKNH